MIGTGIGQGVSVGTSLKWPSPSPLGTLVYKNWTTGSDLSGWTFTPQVAATCEVSGGYLTYTSDGNGGFNTNNRLVYNTYGSTALSKFTIKINMVCPALPQVSLSLIGVGVYPSQAIGSAVACYGTAFWQSGYTGVPSIYCNSTQRSTGSSQLANCVQGDNIRITFSRNDAVYTLLIENTDKLTSQSTTWTESYLNTAALNNSSGNPFINFGKGTYQIKDFEFSSTALKNPPYAILGNSITEGYCGGGYAYAWPAIAMEGNGKVYTMLATQSATTQTVLNTISEILNVNAQTYILMIGGNDYALGVAPSVCQANYRSIVSQLKQNGSRVINCYATPRNGTDMRPLNSFIASEFLTDTNIDTFTDLKTGAYSLLPVDDCGDGTHLSVAGMLKAGTIVKPYTR